MDETSYVQHWATYDLYHHHHHLFAQNRSWTTRPNMRHLQLLVLTGLWTQWCSDSCRLTEFYLLTVTSLQRSRMPVAFYNHFCDVYVSVFVTVCVSVCPRAYLQNCTYVLHQVFACYLSPWLGPDLAAWRYVMYFRFYGWHHTCT